MTLWLRSVLGAALVVCTAITVIASGAPAAPVANERTYVDERAEDVGAPDITSVVVSNDDSGQITFRLLTPNRRRLTQDMRVRIWFTARGTQYFLLVDPYKPKPVTVALYGCEQRPSGLVCAPNLAPPVPSLRFRLSARSRARITFWAIIYSGLRYDTTTGFDFSESRIDRAPSRHPRTWTYVAAFGPP